jgi:Skp family chaperone for outer membrane proteins
MGKGSGRRPLLISEQEAQNNWDKIFCKKKHYELDDGQLTDEQYKKIKNYEYELNKSTGEVEKRFLDGISKPNEEQFNGNVTNTSSTSKDEKRKLPTSTNSGNI